MFMSNSAARETLFLHTAKAVPAAQWVEVPLAGGKFELKLWGKFPPRWLANLTGGLASKGITIHKGYANKLSPTIWQGTFELSRLDMRDLIQQQLLDLRDVLSRILYDQVITIDDNLTLQIIRCVTLHPHDGLDQRLDLGALFLANLPVAIY